VRCRACGELIDPRDSFCNRCGTSLHAQGYTEDGRIRASWIAGKTLKVLITVLVPIAALAAIGYVIYHQLEPAVVAETESTTTTRTIRQTTTSTEAAPTQTFTLIQGATRYETAIAVSKRGFPQSAPAVVLVPGDTYQEALCAAPLAKAYGGPLLLVPPDGLTDGLLAEIERLQPSEVFLVGIVHSSAAKKDLSALPDAPQVTVLNGADQYETAVLVAQQLKTKMGTVSKVVVVPDSTFAEGLAVAPLAASQGWPILLASENQRLPRVVRDVIAEFAVNSVLVVGSPTEVDVDDVVRVSGTDAYDTCALVAEYGLEHGLKIDHVAFATGEDFPDALTAGPYLALYDGVLLLTKGDEVPPSIAALLSARAKDILTLDFIALPGLAGLMEKGSSSTTTEAAATTGTGGAATTTSGP
jgi:putative cell wall-binding protein